MANDRRMKHPKGEVNLLMVHADDHEPVLGVDADLVGKARVRGKMPDYLWDEGGHPNDLFAQRWGVIAPQGSRGDRLLEIIAPLVARRREQQHGEEIRVYRVPEKMTRAAAAQWKKEVFRPQRDLDIDIPRYQLILGDLHEVPLSVQQVQGTDGYVGRLAFDGDEDYAAYVDKVLQWERAPSRHRQGRAIFHTVHDGSSATELGYQSLVKPGISLLNGRLHRGQLNADRIDETGGVVAPDPQQFLDAASLDRPSFLFSLSHGLGPPRRGWRGPAQQREGQGAMSFGREGELRGEDLRDAEFLPGGVWFMLACFGAGSPSESAYQHWLAELRTLGLYGGRPEAALAGLAKHRPFIAAVPRAALANPNGPLGFIGHIDLAWSYAFRELDSRAQNRPAKFMGVAHSILKSDRLGVGLRELSRYLGQVNQELTDFADGQRARPSASDPAQRTRAAHLWMLRQDLAAYVLLGDPAAQLPLANAATPGRRPTTAQMRRHGESNPRSRRVARSSGPQALPLPGDQLEQAICKVIAGESLRRVALEYGVNRDELRNLAKRYRAGGRQAIGMPEG